MSNIITSITLCNVPITPTHQINFTDRLAQINYFSSKVKHTITKCKYQSRTGRLLVKGYVDTLQECNYGYYTNEYNGTSKTFYFWVVARNLVAKEVTELVFQIDVFQTWLFDINFAPCMIEREHVVDDTIGAHTIPEDFEKGDYVTLVKQPVSELQGDPCILMGITDTSGISGTVFGRVYSGFTLKYYELSDYPILNTDIQSLATAGKADAIAFIYTFPRLLLRNNMTVGASGSTITSDFGYLSSETYFNWQNLKQDFSFNNNSYTPYNNKLYCYPYNFITVKNPSGSNVVLKFELFDNLNSICFNVESVLTQNPHITLTPMFYGGKQFAIDDSISMQEFPLCSWNNDNYANWYAQHVHSINAQSSNASSSFHAQQQVTGNNYVNALDNLNTNAEKGALNTALGTVGALGGGNFVGGATGAIGGAVSNYLDYQQGGRNANNDLTNSNLMNTTNYQNAIKSIMASVQDASVQPNTAKGSTASSGLDLARDTATFFIEQTSIKPEYAKMIDMYFQMYGYQVNSVKVPDFTTREKWNYLKTVNCTTYGNVPYDDIQAINSLFNNGLTIWHNEANMYNYNTTNNVV